MTDPLERDWVSVSDLAKAKVINGITTRAGILQKITRCRAKGVSIRTEKMGNQVIVKREDIAKLKS